MRSYLWFVVLGLIPCLGWTATTVIPAPDKPPEKDGKLLTPTGKPQTPSNEMALLPGVPMAKALGGTNLTHPERALDDVSMDDSMEMNQQCFEGQIVDRGCEERCKCTHGMLQCAPRCPLPLIKSGTATGDPHCFLQPVRGDECCGTLVCSSEAEIAEDGCSYKNRTYKFGEVFHDGCESTCNCLEDGAINCSARCPQQNRTSSDRCLSVPDPKDSCCSILYCDVNGDDLALEDDVERPKLVSAIPANVSTVQLNFEKMSVIEKVNAEQSVDQMTWRHATTVGQAVVGLDPGMTYFFRVVSEDGLPSNVVSATLPNVSNNTAICEFKGKKYEIGEEFHDNCTAYCVCSSTGVECASIDCPTDFGLDVLDPTCLEWEPVPAGFKPNPPHCCPQSVVCKNNGSCVYQGLLFENWQDIPDKLSGCEEKCYCSSGNVTCRPRCNQVPKTPPLGLSCPAKQAIISHPPGDECCPTWMCPEDGNGANVTNSSVNETATALPKGGSSVPFLGPYNPDLMTTVKFSNQVTPSPSMKEKSHYPNPSVFTSTSTLKPIVSTGLITPTARPTIMPLLANTSKIGTFKTYNISMSDHGASNSSSGNRPLLPNSFFNTAITPSPHIPIGIINPNNLPNDEELNEKNAPHNVPPKGPPKGPTVDPAFLERLLEYHKYQDEEIGKGKTQHSAPQQSLLPYQPNPSITQNFNVPHSPKVRPGEHLNQIIPPYGQPAQLPTLESNQDFNEHHYVNGHDQHQQPIPPELYHLINQGHRDPYLQPNHASQPPAHHQYVPANELYQVADNRNRLPQKPSNHPYYNNGPPHHESHPFQRPGAPIGLADIIDHIRQHEETDSRTKDTHVYLLASQPSNVGQATPLPGFNIHQPNDPDDIVVHHLEALDDGTVRLIFSVPSVLVGLHGRVELRYTSDRNNNDPSTWEQQVLAPPDDMIATPELEFELKGLQQDTEYKIKITVVMRDLDNSPTSQLLFVRTLPAVQLTTLPPIIPVEPLMRVTKLNSTWATVEWRKFTDYELQFIDGVQLRYKEIDGKVYQATPLIHRAVTSYTIEDLKPDSQYEIGIFFIPFPEQNTELQAQKTVLLNTTIENDPYKFELMLDIHSIKSTSVELTWNGVPYPEDKYVNIFRVIYQYEGGREDMNSFKVAKRDSPAGTLITGLKPDTRYRLWLEAYLTNGKTKKSNVKDFTTNIGVYSTNDIQEGKLEGTPIRKESDYYGPLVGVSILAAITTLACVALLVIITKKHGHNKAPITAAVQRKTAPHTAAYDNPSYKAEMQHETLDL